jgi:hypothetical protein
LKKILEDIKKTLITISQKFISNSSGYLYIFNNSYSIPSFSSKIFYKFYNKYNIDKKIKSEIHTYISTAYHGGRCEIFGNPNLNEIVHYFDFAGMYGQVMLEKFPIGSCKIVYNEDINIDVVGFHYIKYISNVDIPVLPYKHNGKLFFPNTEGLYGLY